MIIVETKRLILRTWQLEDIAEMTKINQDPQVMRYFPKLGDRDTTAWFIGRLEQHHLDHGYSLYAVVLKQTNQMIGFVGLLNVNFQASFTPAIEIGWRLAAKYWGNGYAPEAANAMLDIAFNQFGLEKIVSFTVKDNLNSRRVMQKIGMKYDSKNDFNHPMVDSKSALARHVLYQISRDDYLLQHDKKHSHNDRNSSPKNKT
ncbi:GNAT family N-acetyltransferase [Thiotrichales bacterium 19S3-7]|nr:GNAT family N-acetyltransferase [Thiotrichales bacterium 19S3-7]MCF6801910.1 GNAT family N-acetyltransferase [Thiotrichales bacterium 19S3-11]